MSWLPTNYEVPTASSGYMKFKDGANLFRVVSEPILGVEYWVTLADGKRSPRRKRMGERVPSEELELNPKTGEPEYPKHFWAFVVWNWEIERLQILEITQKGILNSIRALERSKGWGSPLGYDIEVTRAGEGIETTYTVMPVPPKPLDKDTQKLVDEGLPNIDLEALFTGGDPFGKEINLDEVEF